MRDFFISYNRADQRWAEWIAWELEAAGHTTIVQSWDFRPGSNFALEMHSASQAAERTIAILSPDYLEAPYTLAEWAAAFAEDPTAKAGKLLPIRVRECDPAGLLNQIVYIDLVGHSEEDAKKVLVAGVLRGRLKPSSAPPFPRSTSSGVSRTSRYNEPTCIRFLHISDPQYRYTSDGEFHHELFATLDRDVVRDTRGERLAVDGVLITGDIASSGRPEEYHAAERSLSELFGALAIDPALGCFLVPGNHDVDRGSVGPADDFILERLEGEENIARVLAHPPTMELLSSRLRRFYDFTERMLGKARSWRRDRPWRVDIRTIQNLRIAILQINTAWALSAKRNRPIVGEYQIREALTEAGEADLRLWLVHHPLSSLERDEAKSVIRLLESQPGADIVFRGTPHSQSAIDFAVCIGRCHELAAGPLGSGPLDPLCSLTRIAPSTRTAHVEFFRYHSTTRRWMSTRSKAVGELRIDLRVAFQVSVEKKLPQTRNERITANERAKPNHIETTRVSVERKVSKPDLPLAEHSGIIKSVTETQLRGLLADERSILIITAVPVELTAVLGYLKPPPYKRKVYKGHVGQETYYVGRYGAALGIVTMCDTGAIGRDSVILATQQALAEFKPKAVIMVGIAFGKDSTRQRIGDVLVASQVVSYEQQRVGEKNRVFRGAIAQTGPILLNRFRQALSWKFRSKNGEDLTFQVGPLLSGEKLVDQRHYKDDLFGTFPQAIGGEMEGAGLYAVATRTGVEWIVVKGICDWADGTKTDHAQPVAAHAAASLVHHVLSDPTVLDAIR